MFGKSSSDKQFFNSFIEHAKLTLEAASLVQKSFSELGNMKEIASAVAKLELAGDQITYDTVRKLHETWITPFDRTDIHTLISKLDDTLDFAEAVTERVMLFEIVESSQYAKDLSQILVKCCEFILKITELLPTLKKSPVVLEYCLQISKLEHEADVIYRQAIAEIFRKGNDPLMSMKWRDIFDALEAATDRCSEVAHVIEGVVLEYS